MAKFYIDGNGKFIGAFDGAKPPVGSIEIDSPPTDGRMKWNGSAWIVPGDMKEEMDGEKREKEYNKRGATIDKMIVALWERVVDGNPEASDAIEVIRQSVKTDYPK